MRLTWEKVFERGLVGCDIETHEMGDTYRGPIEQVVKKDDVIIIKPKWLAKMEFPGEWKNVPDPPNTIISVSNEPKNIGFGKVRISLGDHDFVIIPKEVSQLDPKKVDGLEILDSPTDPYPPTQPSGDAPGSQLSKNPPAP